MADPLFLGIEGGGTRTVALLADAHGRLVRRAEAGPGNLRLLTEAQLLKLLRSFAKTWPQPAAVCIGMAGMRTEADRRRILSAAAKVWLKTPCVATNDLETALAAAKAKGNPDQGFGAGGQKAKARILVLSGTGSCCYGKNTHGKTAKVGGWGHILGDGGSGYDLAMCGLRTVIQVYDYGRELIPLGRRFLRALQLNEPNDLIGWAQNATKDEIAALAVEVFKEVPKRDPFTSRVVKGAAGSLANEAITCAKRLISSGQPVEFVFAGSNLLRQPGFAKLVAARLKQVCRGAVIMPLQRESAWGAVELARQAYGKDVRAGAKAPDIGVTIAREDARPTALSPTELRNPRSRKLDKLTSAQAIELMLSEDEKIPAALRKERKQIEKALGFIVSAFKRGGKLFYVGAGTSGRLGILDASECPPTFRTPPELVQGIIAGGQRAIWSAVEGAEDDAGAGARAIDFRGVGKRDVVVGIAASGRTPFVHGALAEAKARGAKTVLLCFNPHVRAEKLSRGHLVIAPDLGPEILTGSTRLKAGTATKLVLNIFTTLAMVRLGKVVGNLMVDVNPSNVKLRARAIRIVRELTGADEAAARRALEQSGWVVKAALRKL